MNDDAVLVQHRSYALSGVQRYRLSNGLRVWIEPRPESESVTALLVVRVGSRYETRANNGISHFVEHMVFDGTEKWPTEEEVTDAIVHRGGNSNGWTDEETTTYFVQLAQRDLDLALDWLSQVVFHPTFPADKVDKERDIIFEEKMGRHGYERLLNVLDTLGLGYDLDRAVRRALFPGSTLSLRVIGREEALDRITRQSLLDHYRAHYLPANSALVIVGNVKADEAHDKALSYFGQVPASLTNPIEPSTPPLPRRGPHHVLVRGPLATDQSTLLIGMRTISQSHPDRWALEVLAEVMEEDLLKDIRYRRGWAYEVSAFIDLFADVGYFGIATQVESRHRQDVQRTIERYFDRARRGEITAEQVTNAQTALKGRWALDMEDGTRRAAWLAQWAFEPSAQQAPNFAAAIDVVTVADVQRVVETYYTSERRFTGLHHPIVTAPRGARLLGALAGAGVVMWLARKLLRR